MESVLVEKLAQRIVSAGLLMLVAGVVLVEMLFGWQLQIIHQRRELVRLLNAKYAGKCCLQRYESTNIHEFDVPWFRKILGDRPIRFETNVLLSDDDMELFRAAHISGYSTCTHGFSR